MRKLVSVHMPKCAGTSFKELLIEHYGERIRLDYGDRPLHKSPKRRNIEQAVFDLKNAIASGRLLKWHCYHGHFRAKKYRVLKPRGYAFVTWMRDPAQRLASHYYFWKRHSNPPRQSSLHWRMLNEEWTLEQFCLAPELRNIYSQFLMDFEIDDFDFIGITEHFEDDVAEFLTMFLQKDSYEIPMSNMNEDAGGDKYFHDQPELLQLIQDFHAEDYKMYRAALELRRERMAEG